MEQSASIVPVRDNQNIIMIMSYANLLTVRKKLPIHESQVQRTPCATAMATREEENTSQYHMC
eukprot:800058-Amphidinium_carterae.1